jgi:hypothetical protein
MKKLSDARSKNLLIATNIIAIAIIVALLFRNNSLRGLITECDTMGPNCCSYPDLEGETFGDFKNVVKRYKENSWTAINNSMNQQRNSLDFLDARCIWFSLDSVKQFICTIEKYSRQLHLETKDLGIRLYYGQYPSNRNYYADQHTIFMMPTFSLDGTGEAIDFDPRHNVANNWGTSKNEIRSFASSAASVGLNGRFTILSGNADMNPAIRNSGELCPPKCVSGGNSTFTITDQ